MSEHSFLKTVKRKGSYETDGEASRAANAVFGIIKVWLAPSASDKVRSFLPADASRLWQYSPAPSGMDGFHLEERPRRILHFIHKVQQLGRYGSFLEAQRAASSVMAALSRTIPEDAGRFLRQMFPPEVLGACREKAASRAA